MTPDKKQALITDHEDGFRPSVLASRYNVSVRTVFRVLAEAGARQEVDWRRHRKKPPAPRPRILKPCGTNAAYVRHKRHGEYPCAACLNAHVLANATKTSGG